MPPLPSNSRLLPYHGLDPPNLRVLALVIAPRGHPLVIPTSPEHGVPQPRLTGRHAESVQVPAVADALRGAARQNAEGLARVEGSGYWGGAVERFADPARDGFSGGWSVVDDVAGESVKKACCSFGGPPVTRSSR
jgi:hypothetical protein